MKNFALLFCGLILITACKQKSRFAYDPKNAGSASALLNGYPYISEVTQAHFNSYDSNHRLEIRFSMPQQEGGSRDISIMKIIPTLPHQRVYSTVVKMGSSYTTSKIDSCAARFFVNMGDAGDGTWYVADTIAGNVLDIENYDGSHIKGRFNLTFYRQDIGERPATHGLADTLRFTDGKFDVEIR